MEECKSSARAKVEQVLFYVKQMFGYGKVRYRSLRKNENRLPCCLGLPICCGQNPVWCDVHGIAVSD